MLPSYSNREITCLSFLTLLSTAFAGGYPEPSKSPSVLSCVNDTITSIDTMIAVSTSTVSPRRITITIGTSGEPILPRNDPYVPRSDNSVTSNLPPPQTPESAPAPETPTSTAVPPPTKTAVPPPLEEVTPPLSTPPGPLVSTPSALPPISTPPIVPPPGSSKVPQPAVTP
jgi:hypothetical protein